MNEFIKIEFEFLSIGQKEIIIALLGEMNYEGFEEEGDVLKAYIPAHLYSEDELKNLTDTLQPSYSVSKIENENWNRLWESNFDPVIVDHPFSGHPWVSIRAEFHEPIKTAEHEIIITPKMSFGTGHHATTLMMIQMMSELDFKGKRVLDFGTGTGILAILAEKLGASIVSAIDSDFQSINNASENFASNNCRRIQVSQSSSAEGNNRYDIILSNIVKSVILQNLPACASQLGDEGILLLSGILLEDEETIVKSAEKNRLIVSKKIVSERWLGLEMRYAHNIISGANTVSR